MWPLFSVVGRLFSSVADGGGVKDRRQAFAQLLKQQFDPGHQALHRDEKHAIHRDRSAPGDSETAVTSTPGSEEGGSCQWIEFVWGTEKTIDECHWSDIHWRFYRDGRIAFHAKMKNASHGLDTGDIQGHRIEVRTRDGLLIGAWSAAFFVRSRGAVSHFPATLLDEHPLLMKHFDELSEHQHGYWYYER